jgi:hypothetical protein
MIDPFVITKIVDFLPVSKRFQLAKFLKSKMLARILFERCHQTEPICIYTDSEKPTIISCLKNQKILTDNAPSIDFTPYTNYAIRNYAFFFQVDEKIIHTFQFQNPKYAALPFVEEIRETAFYEINKLAFWVNINQTHMYRFDRLVQTQYFELAPGFFFDPIIIGNTLYSDYYGDTIVFQNLTNKESYSIKLLEQTHFDVFAKDLINIDFQENGKSETFTNGDLLLPKDIENNSLRNCLFKFRLVDGSPNQIILEFIKFLPKEDEIWFRFDEINGTYYTRNDTLKYIKCYKRENEVATIKVPELTEKHTVESLDKYRLMVLLETKIILIDVASGTVESEVDMIKKIPNLVELRIVQAVGDYFHVSVSLKDTPFGKYIVYYCDQEFSIVYNVTAENYFVHSD